MPVLLWGAQDLVLTSVPFHSPQTGGLWPASFSESSSLSSSSSIEANGGVNAGLKKFWKDASENADGRDKLRTIQWNHFNKMIREDAWAKSHSPGAVGSLGCVTLWTFSDSALIAAHHIPSPGRGSNGAWSSLSLAVTAFFLKRELVAPQEDEVSRGSCTPALGCVLRPAESVNNACAGTGSQVTIEAFAAFVGACASARARSSGSSLDTLECLEIVAVRAANFCNWHARQSPSEYRTQ